MAGLENRLARRVQALSDLLGAENQLPTSGSTTAHSVNQFVTTNGTVVASTSAAELELPPLTRGARVLELAAPSLLLAWRFREAGFAYQGLTFSPVVAALAAQELSSPGEPCPLIEFSDEALGRLSKMRFDAVFVSVNSANWSTRRVEWLLEVASGVLAPAGRLFLSLPLSFADQKEIGWHPITLCRKVGLEANELNHAIDSTQMNLLTEWQRQLGSKSALVASRVCELS